MRKGFDAPDARFWRAQRAADYCGMGVSTFRKWARKIGAERRIGSLVRYDSEVINKVMDSMGTDPDE